MGNLQFSFVKTILNSERFIKPITTTDWLFI